LRLDKRLITLRGKQVTVCGAGRHSKTILYIPPYFETLYSKGKFKSATLVYRKKLKQFWIQMSFEIETQEPFQGDAIGVDRGIKNIVALSDGTLISGKPILKINRKYLYNRTMLQKKGTRSATRRLRAIGGKEKRFIRNMNHVVTKKLAAAPYSVFVLEKLKNVSKKNRGKVSNKRIHGWSYFQFEQFLEYKLEEKGKSVVFINPAYTSQDCSCCGHRDKLSRTKSLFKCTVCSYAAHSDINAAKNILTKHLSAQSAEQGTVNCPDAISFMVKTVQPFASLAL
jgi:IS605 OrfB family transposase